MLKFPHARLALYNELLRCKRSCGEALAEIACSLGVVSRDSLQNVKLDETDGECGCLRVGKAIVMAALAARSCNPADAEMVWESIKKDIARYSESVAFHHIPNLSAIECGRMAPVVLDFILQHLANLQ